MCCECSHQLLKTLDAIQLLGRTDKPLADPASWQPVDQVGSYQGQPWPSLSVQRKSCEMVERIKLNKKMIIRQIKKRL